MLSVVTPSLNQGRFIEDALDSVLKQPGEVEHIVVDGGSTDETASVLARYPRVRVLRDPGIGQSHAVNIGLRAARGELIGWLNADDRYVAGVFDSVRAAFDANPNAGIVYGNARFVDERTGTTDVPRLGPFDRELLLSGVCRIAQPAAFIRRSLFDQVGLLDESLKLAMDFEFWLRASDVASLVWVDEVWADFRIHPDSKTGAGYRQFWPERRGVSRAYGGPFFSTDLRQEIEVRLRTLAGMVRHRRWSSPPR